MEIQQAFRLLGCFVLVLTMVMVAVWFGTLS
jgi:hypothetical protein